MEALHSDTAEYNGTHLSDSAKSGVSGCQDIHRQVTRLEDKIPQEVLGTDETDVGLVSRGCDRPARPSVDPGQEDWPDDITN